jgi:hypothetical protein
MATRTSLFIFMIVVLLAAGITGFRAFESMPMADSVYSTVSAVTFSSSTAGFSAEGKLLNTALALASVAVIIWAFVNFHQHTRGNETSPTEYFRLMPQDEGLVLREIKASKGIAGKTKLAMLQQTGVLVMAVKKGKSFQLNVPFERKITSGSAILVLGTELQISEVEKAKK